MESVSVSIAVAALVVATAAMRRARDASREAARSREGQALDYIEMARANGDIWDAINELRAVGSAAGRNREPASEEALQ